MAVKVHVDYKVKFREVEVLKHLSLFQEEHPGQDYVRRMQDSFMINGPLGDHHCIVYEPLLCTAMDFRNALPRQIMTPVILKHVLRHALQGLDYLHSVGGVIHTGNTMPSMCIPPLIPC